VEDALPLLREESQTDDDEEWECVNGTHGPEPVWATDGEVSIANWRVNVQSIVGASEKTHFDWGFVLCGLRKSVIGLRRFCDQWK
jgi:hypothetical protein